MSTWLCKNIPFTSFEASISPFLEAETEWEGDCGKSGLADSFLVLCWPRAGSWSVKREAQACPQGAPGLGGFEVESPTSRTRRIPLPSSHTSHCLHSCLSHAVLNTC